MIMTSQTGGDGAPTPRELEGPVGNGTIPISPAIQNPDSQGATTEDAMPHIDVGRVSEHPKRYSKESQKKIQEACAAAYRPGSPGPGRRERNQVPAGESETDKDSGQEMATPPLDAALVDVKVPHPHIRAAIVELHAAKKELEEADHDFKGHRGAAIEAIGAAVTSLEKVLPHAK
jgi:hypothetical protein